MLKIRRYKPSDNAAVKELNLMGINQMMEMDLVKDRPDIPNLDSDFDDIENVYIKNRGDFLVGLRGNEIVAIGAIKKYSETCGEIKRIRIRRDCQRKGYGETMILKLIELAKKLKYRELVLDTMTSNLPAQRLFEKTGFHVITRGTRGPFNLIYYGKKLLY